jgi:hypothetical protein
MALAVSPWETFVARYLVEFANNCDTALGQMMNSPLQIRLARNVLRLPRQFVQLGRSLFRKRAADLGDSLGYSPRVFGIDRDCLPVMVQHAIGHCRCNGAIGFGGNACYLRNLEISRAELLQAPDDAVGFDAAHVQVLGTEILPSLTELFVLLLFA